MISFVKRFNFDQVLPRIDAELICQNLTELTFNMFAAAQKLWHKEDATFYLTLMCQDLAEQFVWLSSQGNTALREYVDMFVATVSDLDKEFADKSIDSILMLLGTSLDRGNEYATGDWCAVVICMARKAGYEFDF